jgi:hypothetical protein
VRAKATELNPSANASNDACGGGVRGRACTDRHLRLRGKFQPSSPSPCTKSTLHFTTFNLHDLKHTHSCILLPI